MMNTDYFCHKYGGYGSESLCADNCEECKASDRLNRFFCDTVKKEIHFNNVVKGQYDILQGDKVIGMVFTQNTASFIYTTWIFFKAYYDDEIIDFIQARENEVTNLQRDCLDYCKRVIVKGKIRKIEDLGYNY